MKLFHMNANLLIGIVLSLAVVGGGGYLVYSNIQSESEVAVQTDIDVQKRTEQNEKDNAISGTFASLLGLGQSLRCEFAFDDGTNVSNGVFYIAQGGERLRGDFNVVASAGGSMEGHLIRNDGFNYMWSSQMEQGVKMEIKPGDEDEIFASDNDSVPIDENTTYTCAPWPIDTSKFVVPTEVEFMDIGAQLESFGAIEGSLDLGDIQSAQCGACEQIPDANAKAQCLQALSC